MFVPARVLLLFHMVQTRVVSKQSSIHMQTRAMHACIIQTCTVL
jgi:hypothetical protein